MLGYLEYLDVPSKIGLAIVGCVLVMQIVVEILEFKGKIVPEFLSIRKFFTRRKTEKKETAQILKDVKKLLADVNVHYSADNITKRDSWMSWVNERAEVYDKSIDDFTNGLAAITTALNANTKLTEELFIQGSRDRIIAFSSKVADENALVSMEEFNRIFKVYDDYEDYLKAHNLTNGEVEIAHRIIEEAYELRLKTRSFTEYIRGYITSE